MNYSEAKGLREITKLKGLRKSEERYGLIVEVSEDDCEDLFDCGDFSVRVFKEGRLTIEVCEDACEDLPDGW